MQSPDHSPPAPLSVTGEGGDGARVLPPLTVGARVSAEKRDVARHFRKHPTNAEREAWRLLRKRGVLGLKFRRQQPIRGFIVDFYCADYGIVLELDGEVHATQHDQDRARDAVLEGVGLKVVRLPNHELSHARLEEVLLPLIQGPSQTELRQANARRRKR